MLTIFFFPIIRLQEDRLEEKEKFISIWTRKGKNQPLIPFKTKFPRDAAMVFSALWKKQIDRDGSKHTALILDSVVDTAPYERILDWINLCVDEGNDIKFPDVSSPTASAKLGCSPGVPPISLHSSRYHCIPQTMH